jgi:hypothetical protein
MAKFLKKCGRICKYKNMQKKNINEKLLDVLYGWSHLMMNRSCLHCLRNNTWDATQVHTAKQWVKNFYEVSLKFTFCYSFMTDDKITFINDFTNFSSIFDSSPSNVKYKYSCLKKFKCDFRRCMFPLLWCFDKILSI